ncbi:hypothetical protein ACOMHN_030946 [Nucella lapillus]
MFTRLKGAASQAMSKSSETAPTKEDILSSLEQFGENAVRSSKESNNNTKRRDSQDRENVDPLERHWEVVEDPTEKTTTPTSGQHSYSVEWERHFNRPYYLRWLRQQAIAGELRPCRFRSICWRLFLEVLPEDMTAWSDKAHQDRMKYETLKCKLITNPRRAVDSVNVMVNNPLSQDEESPWNKFFQDNELRLTIKQDVIRTYPKIEFFQSNQMRNVMVDILFIFAKENPEVSYQQGMHELLAPIIFVLHYDHQAFLHASETDNVLPIIKDMLDPRYLEHDAYYMFCQVMATVEPWYLAKDICSAPKRRHDVFTSQPFTRSQELIPSSVIVTKLTRIQDYLLKKFDMELHAHLETLEIAPQIYGIRWLRLLFGREFPMQDLLMLWDAIFADGIGFDLVDYIFVAMMLYIRDLLLASDYAGCLTALMKFPQVSDAHYFIDKSLWLREPSQYLRPPNYSHQVTARSHSSSSKAKQAPQAQKYRGGFSSFSRKFSRPKTLSVSTFEKNLPKSSSEPMNLQTEISPVSPPQYKRGSTASLSQVEDSMYRQRGQSSSSLGRTDPSYLRSAQSSPAGYSPVGFSPEEPSAHSSPTKYSTLPSRGKAKGRKLSKQKQSKGGRPEKRRKKYVLSKQKSQPNCPTDKDASFCVPVDCASTPFKDTQAALVQVVPTPVTDEALPSLKGQILRPLSQLEGPLTDIEEEYFTRMVRIKLSEASDKMTVRCKTGGQPIILQKIVKARKASTQARTPLRKKRAKTMNKIRLNISGNTEEDAAKQQSTELKSAPKARKRLVLKEAKCGPVSVTAKQGAAIRVGLGLSETKHRVQRRYFRWLGVHFASERKEKKEQLKAQGAEIEGQMRTLEVWNDTEKNMDLTPTPCAGIKDIPSYVTRLLDEYDSQGRLTWHDGSIPEDEIWIKIGGDHGGKSFKMMLQVANLANANSKHNTCMFTIVECKDTPENLRRLLVPYKDQLSELETMQWKEKRTRVFVFGDYDFLTKMYGLSGAQGIHPCLYCTATKSAIQLSPDLNKRNISPRSVVQIKRDYKQYRRAGKKKKDAQLFNNVVRHPVIDVELEQVAPPYLHILLGIVKKHHDLLEDQCHKLDQQVARSVASGDGTNCDMFSAPFHKYIKDAKKLKGQQSHLKNLKSKAKREDSMELQNKIRQQENTISETKAALSLPIRAGPIAANLDKTLRENKIFPQAYHSRSLVGNHCNKYLREDAYKSICGSVSEITKDVTNRKDIQEKARGISGKFTHLNSMFSNVHQRISHQRAIGCEEIENIETCISTYMAYFRQAFPHVAVIPKQHLLEHHCVPWIRRWGTGMALLGEQGGEETHATVNSLKRRVDGLKNHQHRLKTLLREQLMLVAPAFHDEQDLQQQVSAQQGQLNDRAAMCRYCASKLDVHIGRLQEELSKQKLDTEDEIMVSLAGIKLVRDVLNGTLRFSRNILEEDGEILISDNHYQPVVSPDCDMADPPGTIATNGTKRGVPPSQSKERQRRMFYMSSGETSSAAESPESFNGTGSGLPSHHLSDSASNTEYELGDLPKRRSTSVGGKGGHSAGLLEDSAADTSSQASSYAASGLFGSNNTEDSPNLLYSKDWVTDLA